MIPSARDIDFVFALAIFDTQYSDDLRSEMLSVTGGIRAERRLSRCRTRYRRAQNRARCDCWPVALLYDI